MVYQAGVSACVARGYGWGQDKSGHGPPCIVDNLVTVMTLLQRVIQVIGRPWWMGWFRRRYYALSDGKVLWGIRWFIYDMADRLGECEDDGDAMAVSRDDFQKAIDEIWGGPKP